MAACGRPLATQHMLGHVQARRICGSRLHSHQCAANARRPAQLRLRSRRCVSAAFFGGRDDAGWQQPSPLNAFLARPQGLLLELLLGAVILTAGFPILLTIGSFAAAAFMVSMVVAGTFLAAFTVLTTVLPVMLGIGAVGAFIGWQYLQSGDGKKLRETYETWRKRLAPGAPSADDVIGRNAGRQSSGASGRDRERDREVEEAYNNMDRELADWDERLRRSSRR